MQHVVQFRVARRYRGSVPPTKSTETLNKCCDCPKDTARVARGPSATKSSSFSSKR